MDAATDPVHQHPRSVCFNARQRRLHRRWLPERVAIIDALEVIDGDAAGLTFGADGEPMVGYLAEEPDDLAKRSRRIAHCARVQTVRVRDGKATLALSCCHDRMCPMCADRRARRNAIAIAALVAKMDRPRFITLTLASSDAPLGDQIDRLYAAFRKLRGWKAWKARCRGGIFANENTLNLDIASGDYGRFHPHLHLIVDGEYFDQKFLSELWRKATGDSFIVDIRAVTPERIGYLAKSTAAAEAKRIADELAHNAKATRKRKGVPISEWPREKIREYAAALHGRRLMSTFGTMHAVEVDPDPEAEELFEKSASEELCTLGALIEVADSGDEHAGRAVEILARVGGMFQRALSEPSALRITPEPPQQWELTFAFDVCRRVAKGEALDRGDYCHKAETVQTPRPPDSRLFGPDPPAPPRWQYSAGA